MDLLKFLLFSGGARYSLAFLRNYKRRSIVNSSQNLSTVCADLRKEYSDRGINEDDVVVKSGPHALFKAWLEEACNLKVLEPNAMCLATCQNNIPSSRFVLLKGYDESGFVWYTNYNSKKGADLLANPNAALTFWWGPLERSVRIEGVVEKVSAEESDTYFSCRPRGSQLGAWTSDQSHDISSREALDKQEQEVIARFKDTENIPRPPHWGGYRLKPKRIEFWKGRASRVHDRIVYERSDTSGEWDMRRLQP